MVIVYIAGPITGVLNYKEAFDVAEAELKEKGHIVLNPSTLPSGLNEYMEICYKMIDQADSIYLLNGWQNSIGATAEKKYAHDKGLEVNYEKTSIGDAIQLWLRIV